MNTPKFTPKEQAQIEAGLTEAQAVERINHLRPIVQESREAAFEKMRPLGLTGLAQVLLLHDDGVFTAEQTIKSMRETLGIPVTPESRELGQLQAALYQGRLRGKASQPGAGGHYAL